MKMFARSASLLLLVLMGISGITLGYPTWTRVYEQYGGSHFMEVIPLDNGNSICMGALGSSTVVVAVDQYGSVLWDYYAEGSAEGLVECPGHGVILLTYNGNTPSRHWLIGLSYSGNELWNQLHYYDASNLTPTSDGCVVYLTPDEFIRKVDHNGSTVWHNQPLPDTDESIRIGPAPAIPGGFHFIAQRNDLVSGSYSTCVTGACDSEGNILWDFEWGGSIEDGELLFSGGPLGDDMGNCYSSMGYGEICGPMFTALFKHDSNGNLIWEFPELYTYHLTRANDGNLITHQGVGGLDPYLVIAKLDKTTGAIIDLMSPRLDVYFWAIRSCPAGGYISAGYENGSGHPILLRTNDRLQFLPPDVQHPEETQAVEEFRVGVLDNPAESLARIELSGDVALGTSVAVFDACGRMVSRSWEETNPEGTLDIEVSAFPKGVYTVIARSPDNTTSSCRLLKI